MTKLLTLQSAVPAGVRAIKRLALLVVVIGFSCAAGATAHAQNSRTFVSATGTDTSNTECSAAAPCLTFAHALTETSSGGEINCLTPGGFGAVTIAIPVTINCEGASNGGVSVTIGAAITVTTTGDVNLVGLDINGNANSNSTYGVSVTSAANVVVRHCKVYGFSGNNSVGVYLTGAGTVFVDNVLVTGNETGVYNGNTTGVANMSVRNSTISNNVFGIAAQSLAGMHTGVTIEQTTLAFNYWGLWLASAKAVAVIGSSTVVNNNIGVSSQTGSIVYSFKNNQIGGNGTDGTPLTAYPGGPLN